MDKLTTFTQYFKENRTQFDAILFDIDGTLSLGKNPIDGAKELIEYLDEISFPYLYLTNDGCNSPAEKAGYMNKSGIPARQECILSAGNAIALWAKENYHDGKFFQLGRAGNPSFLDLAGIPHTENPAEVKECCGVFCGEGAYDWQPAIEATFNLLLKHPEYPLLVANPDSYWASLRFQGWGIGSGSVARFICQVLHDAGKEVSPIYLGKPYAPIYQCVFPVLAQRFPHLNFQKPSRIVMVGDSLASDIAGAKANGLSSALVMTGVTSFELLKNAPESCRPDMVFRSI